MGITEELLKSKKNVAPDSNGNMGITQELLLRRKAGLRPQVSPSENVGYDISMGGLLAQRNAANMEEKINRGLRENAVSPTQALEQMRGYTFSPAPSITLPTAQEMDAHDLQQTLKIADQKKAELDQQIAEQKAVQQKNNAGAAPAYAAISGTQQLRPAQISAPKSAAAGQNVKPVEQTEQEKAFEQASQRIWELEREKDALSYIQDNVGKTYDDNFLGQFGASYTLGRLTQDESLAWNKYLDNPTEENRAYAEAIGQVISAFQLENQEVLADDATLPWVSQSLANYLPQVADQVKYGAVGAVSGGTVGSVIPVLGTAAGIKAGITAASGVYSYQTMRGAAFKTLLDLGVPENVAREAANDEAVVSSAIEMADTGIDLLTLGGKELILALTGGTAKTAAKKGAESAVKKFLKALGKYGLNVAGEWTEEATQQAVSIANANRVETGDMNGILDLAGDAAKVFGKALWDKEDKNRAEILEAGEQGAIVAGLMGPLQAGFNQLAYTGVTALDNKASADYGQQLRSQGLETVTIEAGLKFDEGSRIRQMAEAMQQKQQNGQEVTDVELGDLYRQIKIGARQEYQNAVQQAQNETAVQQQEESGIMLPTADEMDAMLGVGSAESSLRQSGMEAGATEQAIESAERISTALGRDIQFFRQEAGERGTVNGFFDPNTGTIYVNSQSQNPVAQIIAHELTHSVEMADSYQELQSVVMDQLQKNGIDINRRRQEIQALYERNNVELKDQAEIDQEIVAQFVETRLLTDEQTILDLTRTNRSLMERVLDWINRTLQKLGVRKTTERDTLEKARDLYARALQESREQEQNAAAAQQQKEVQDVVQYLRNALASGEITESEYDEAMESVMEQASLAGVDLLDEKQYSISEDSQGRELTPEQAEFFKNSQIRDENGNLMVVYHGTDATFTMFDRTRGRSTMDIQGSFFSPWELDAQGYGKNVEKYYLNLKNPADEGTAYKALNRFKGQNNAGVKAREYLESKGYDGVNNSGEEFIAFYPEQIKQVGNLKPTNDPDIRYSISENTDSQGRELSEKQQEFFADSMARVQEDGSYWYGEGNLVPVFHATSNEFTVFDREKLGENTAGNAADEALESTSYVGFWFNTSDISKKTRANRAEEVYLNIKRPYDAGTVEGLASDILDRTDDEGTPAERGAEFADWLRWNGYDGVVVHDEEFGGISFVALEPEQIKRVDNLNPTSDPDIRYSVSDNQQQDVDGTITLPTADSESQLLRDQLPVKAKTYLQRAERAMMEQIGQSLSIPYRARRDILTNAVREMSEEYLSTGKISEKTRRSLFEEAYEAGIVQDREFLDQYQGLRDYLRDTTLRISKQDSADIPDFNDYRRRNFGRLNISTQGGTNIDQVYKELSEIWPELFNEQRESTPSDQLNRISEVVKNFQVTERSLDEYYGADAAEFKRYAYHDFSTAIDEQLQELQAVRRYQEQSQRQQSVEEQKPKTIEEVVQLWDQFKTEKRNYEKVAAKNLLTDEDERLVGQLLRGEITEQALDSETNNVKGILAVYESKKEFDRIAKQLRAWNADRRNTLKKLADQYLETANGWKDKKSGILYSRETMERNIRDIVPDEALAQSIIDEYFTPVHKATASATRMKNTFRQRVKSMNLSRDIAKGNIVSEAHAVQLLGEAEDNIRMLEKSKWTKERDGKTIEEWRKVVSDLWKENPNLDQKKIRDAVDSFRKIYDELFQQMNEVRVRNGYEPINYRSGYFPHFQPGDGDGILAAFGRAMGISTDVTALPTAINGLTHTFRPGIQWFGNAQERLGFNTAYDAVEGFDKYIEGVADVIYQTDNIQKLRQLANQVRYRTTSEGIRKQVDAVLADESLSEIDKQNRIEKIYESGQFTLSNFVVELEEYTNLLANKKSRHDRSVETDAGRKWYKLAKDIEGRVAANMVSINPASWLTNLIPLTQAWAGVKNTDILRGMWDTLRGMNKTDGMVERSTFLTNRRGSDPLVKAWEQGTMPEKNVQKAIKQAGKAAGKAGDVLSSPMEIIDNITAESLVRARYAQNIRKGLSEQNAIDEADAWVAGVMADRSKGAMPTLFMRKNPLTKLVTQFQLEVNNQLSYLFKDIPRETKKAGIKVLTWALVKFAVGAWLYDEIYEYLIGRRPALDPIGILNDTVGDLTGWEIPELVIGAVTGNMPEPRDEKTSLYDAMANMGAELLEQVPFTGALNLFGADLDTGRLPVSNAIPNLANIIKALSDDDLAGNKRADLFLRELADTAGAYLLLPYGGGQVKKILQTAEAIVRGGRYSITNEGEKKLQYPVYNDEAMDIAENAVFGSLFGTTALPAGREWIENGFGSLSVDQTIAYEAMKEAGAEDETAFRVIQDYRAAESNEEKREVIRNADINGEAKAALYYQLMASDTERKQLDLLDDAGQDMGEIIDTLLDIKDMDAEAREDSETDEEKPLFTEKQIEAVSQAGLDENDAVLAAVEQENIWANRDLTTDEKKAEFSRWLNEQGYSADEQHAIYNAIIEGGESESEAGQENRYAKLVSSGIDDDIAYAITSDISRLEPVNGEENVSKEQKRQVVFDRIGDPDEQLMALETINTESQQEKFVQANKEGVSPEKYAAAIEEIQQYDADGNGSLTQEEVENALNSIGRSGLMLPGGDGDFTLSTRDKAVIWQLSNKSWKPDNNPFDVEVGKKIYDALNS